MSNILVIIPRKDPSFSQCNKVLLEVGNHAPCMYQKHLFKSKKVVISLHAQTSLGCIMFQNPSQPKLENILKLQQTFPEHTDSNKEVERTGAFPEFIEP